MQKKKSKRKEKLRFMRAPHGCGLCGSENPMAKLKCCGNWLCDDMFLNVIMQKPPDEGCFLGHCYRTLCGIHFINGHEGRWQDCSVCRGMLDDVMYTHYATNKFNFEPISNPPRIGPIHCHKCSKKIDIQNDFLKKVDKGYVCIKCVDSLLTLSDFKKCDQFVEVRVVRKLTPEEQASLDV